MLRHIGSRESQRCLNCGKESRLIAGVLQLCSDCIRRHFTDVLPQIQKAHGETREAFGLPRQPPNHPSGIRCRICTNECSIPDGGKSYCGLRFNRANKLTGAISDKGNVSWYHDPLPTNCVASWVCPAETGAGYPQLAYRRGPEFGYTNLAVFYQACSFNCLFCQNWHYRTAVSRRIAISASQLANEVDDNTACICYFGGDPTPQLPHAIKTSKIALEQNRDRILRICWETNGSMHPAMLRRMAELSLASGGCIKFDLKAWSQELHMALCGVSNSRTLDNFKMLVDYVKKRPSPPFLVASTLLVPGYIDADEVYKIATFIADLEVNIPYSLLAFAPQFYMNDLPPTSKSHAAECKQAAEAAGLKNVRLGNLHLLGNNY